jgi:hypothetical protein
MPMLWPYFVCVCLCVCILNKTKNVKKVENKKSELEKRKTQSMMLNVLFLCVLFAARGEISEQRIDKNIATSARSHVVLSISAVPSIKIT